MKNQITLLLFLLVAMQLAAQKINDVNNVFISSWGTNFPKAIESSGWNNANGKSYTKANYTFFNGEATSGMQSSESIGAVLNLSVSVRKGTLQVIMEDQEGNPIFDRIFETNREFTTDVAMVANQPYKIRFIGTNTKGSYVCQWIEKTNQ